MTSEKTFVPCDGCSGHDCDDGCAYPGVDKAASVVRNFRTTERTPQQIIGHDAYIQLIFEGYQVTRPVPDVPELVRYAMSLSYAVVGGHSPKLEEVKDGALVLHSQAVAVIAEWRKRYHETHELLLNVDEKLQTAETKLAQYEAQEPVAWMYVNDDGECEQIEYGKSFDDPHITNLYTSPAPCPDLKAENERLRGALEDVQGYVREERASLATIDPDFFAKYEVLKKVGKFIRDAFAALNPSEPRT